MPEAIVGPETRTPQIQPAVVAGTEPITAIAPDEVIATVPVGEPVAIEIQGELDMTPRIAEHVPTGDEVLDEFASESGVKLEIDEGESEDRWLELQHDGVSFEMRNAGVDPAPGNVLAGGAPVMSYETYISAELTPKEYFVLDITREGVISKISDLLGVGDVKSDDPEFDAKICIKSSDGDLARKVLENPALRKAILEMAEAADIELEVTDDHESWDMNDGNVVLGLQINREVKDLAEARAMRGVVTMMYDGMKAAGVL